MSSFKEITENFLVHDFNNKTGEAVHITDFPTFYRLVDTAATNFSLNHLSEKVDKSIAEKVLKLQNFSDISHDSSDYDYFLSLASGKQQLVRASLHREITENENAFGLSPIEREVFVGSLEMQNGFDDLYRQWRTFIVEGSIYQEIAKKEKDVIGSGKKYLQEKGLLDEVNNDYLYVVFAQEGDTIVKKSYADAFPEPIAKIESAMDMLVANLKNLPLEKQEDKEERDNWVGYYSAFKAALTNKTSDEAEQERLYAELDTVWMKLRGNLQVVHPMESYLAPFGTVEPELRLLYKDTSQEKINTTMVTTKKELTKYLLKTFPDSEALQNCLRAMEASVAGIYVVLPSGRKLDARAAGQNIPNRTEVRDKYGAKISIDMQTLDQRWTMQEEKLLLLFGRENFEKHFVNKEKIIAATADIVVAGHEFGHNAFMRAETRGTIGQDMVKNMEENKSDLSIISAAPDFLSVEKQQVFLKGFFGMHIRSIIYKGDHSRKPYYNAAICNINIMHEAGLVTQTDEGWLYDDSSENLEKFFTRSREIFKELATVYETMSPEKAQEYISSYYKETAFIKNLEVSLGVL